MNQQSNPPNSNEISIKEAADILNVSSAYVIKLIDEKQLSYREVDERQHILLDDVLVFQKKMEATRKESLAFLTE